MDDQRRAGLEGIATIFEIRRSHRNSGCRDPPQELGGHICRRIATDGWGRGTVSLLPNYLSTRMPSARLLAIRENYSVWELRRAIDTATFERSSLADSKLATLSRVFPMNPHAHFRDKIRHRFLIFDGWRRSPVEGVQVGYDKPDRRVGNPPQASLQISERIGLSESKIDSQGRGLLMRAAQVKLLCRYMIGEDLPQIEFYSA